MFFEGLVALLAITVFLLIVFSDSWTGKGKSSTYFQKVQQPQGKGWRLADIPDDKEHDPFFSKLNTL